MKKCYFCRGTIERARIEYMARSEGGYVLVRDLPVERCTQCGEVYLDEAASKEVDTALSNAGQAAERLEVPVVRAG